MSHLDSNDSSSGIDSELPSAPIAGLRDGARPLREGLPPSYRMRADAHYVEQLASRPQIEGGQSLDVNLIDAPDLPDATSLEPLIQSIRRHGLLQPLLVRPRDERYRLIAGRKRLAAAIAAGMREVPCLCHDVDGDDARRLAEATNVRPAVPPAPSPLADATQSAGALLARALDALTTCSTMLSARTSELSRDVITELIRAEAWRASCLLGAGQLIRGEAVPKRASVQVTTLVERVMYHFRLEQRFRGVELETSNDLPEQTRVLADDQILCQAISGLLTATLALLDGLPGSRITIGVARDAGGDVVFAVSQNCISPPEMWMTRAFDPTWTARPGEALALVGMVAAKVAAEAHGGNATVVGHGRGSRIALTIPSRA